MANFSGNNAGRYAVNVDGANKTVGTLNFATVSGYTIGTNAGNALTLHALSGDSDTINVSAGSHTIAAPVTAAENLFINIFTSTTLSMTGSITAPSLAKYGHGNLSLAGGSTFSGTVLEHAGTLDITGSVLASGYTSIAPSAGDTATLTLRGTSHYTSNNDFNVGDTGDTVTAANGTLTIADSATLTIGTGGGFYVGSGFFAGTHATGTVNQTGGTLTANGNFDGAFIIGGRGSAIAAGTYALSGGTVNANTNLFVGGMGTGSVVQTGGVFNAAVFLSIGRYAGANGTYNIAAGTLNQTSGTANLIVGESGTGALTVSGTASVLLNAPLILGKNSGAVGTVNLNGGTITTSSISRGTGAATFNFNGGTLRARTSGSSFMQNLTNAYVQTGGAVVDTQSFNITIAQRLLHDPALGSATDGGLIKLGAGNLTLSGAVSYTGPTAINSGQLIFANASSSIASATGAGTLRVASNDALASDGVNVSVWQIDGAQAIRTNATNAATSKVASLILAGSNDAWAGSLDLRNNAAHRRISRRSLEGDSHRHVAKPNRLRNQPQCRHPQLHPRSQHGPRPRRQQPDPALSIPRPPVDSNSILIAPELLGNANLNGHVDLNDLNTVLNHLGATTPNWTDGNFDGASTIDLNDLNDVLNNLGVTFAGNATVIAFEALVASAQAPEPTTLALLSLAAPLLLGRRKRM